MYNDTLYSTIYKQSSTDWSNDKSTPIHSSTHSQVLIYGTNKMWITNFDYKESTIFKQITAAKV